MTQAQIDTLLDSFIGHYAGQRVDYFGYAGECISLDKRWVDAVTNGKLNGPMKAPATAHGRGSDYWAYPPAEVLRYFTKETWYPNRDYPRGSMVVYTTTSHIGTYLGKGQPGYASLFEQNADPDGSVAGTHQRSLSRINGILTIKVDPPAQSGVVGKHINIPKDSGDWHLYHENGPYTVSAGQWITILHPSTSSTGYTYEIVGDKGNGVYVILSPTWGRGALYTKGSKFTIK